jgi:hypothetical protein
MPCAPRPDNKAKKIAYKILGKPANLAYKPTAEQKRINMLLVQEQLTRTR